MPQRPVSTYRIQFHKDFTLTDLEQALPYLEQAGISTIYASPVFESVPGSTHGYDALNPHRIHPETGTEEQFRALLRRLKEQHIGWLQDIVPNHMAFDHRNPWLTDLLEKGPLSLYAAFFDSVFTSDMYKGKMMVPFLGSPQEDVINNGELRVIYQDGRMIFSYYGTVYPLHIVSYRKILKTGRRKPDTVKQLLDQLELVHRIQEPDQYAGSWNEFLLQLSSSFHDPAVAAWLNSALEKVNNDPALLSQLADEQVYRLCHWKETDRQITYRRFFTVNGLICLNIQNNEVFEHFHSYIRSLTEEGLLTGVRVDHIDGLFDPSSYLGRLRRLTGDDAFIVVEKILGEGEQLPEQWPVEGTTGYDFLAFINNLFTNKSSKEPLTRFYSELTGENTGIQQQIAEKKAYILCHHMAGELDNLHRLLLESDLLREDEPLIQDESLKLAIGEFLIQCPVYRFYGNRMPLPEKEAEQVRLVFRQIHSVKPELAPAAEALEDILLNRPGEEDEAYRSRVLYFYQRCMQFSGPLMAKGVEDTLMYTYNRFIAHNEVGDSPAAFGLTPEEFHRIMLERQQKQPLSMNATSTHDTKRGEDVRARLNVLSDIADEWMEKVNEWIALNSPLKRRGAPDINDEYLIYQTLTGCYPMPGQADRQLRNRLQLYIQKALREAKRHSNWSSPDLKYEKTTKNFVAAILKKDSAFFKDFEAFHRRITDFGIINSLAQVLLKFTCPGVPDIYQGCELWDLSLVDPDNRRPVDYSQRLKMLSALHDTGETGDLATVLWQNRYSGQIKLWLTHTLLTLRKQEAELFEKGEYIPLKVRGRYKDHIIAFARRYRRKWHVTVIPLHLAALCKKQGTEPTTVQWRNTKIVFPPEAPAEWNQLLSDDTLKATQQELAVKDILGVQPFALLQYETRPDERSAGILMHISSLPSPFGIGDFGPEAHRFVSFLSSSKQKYWQILPLSPTEKGSGHSPYSSYSSMAGNPLLISPELLAGEGLLDFNELKQYHLPSKDKADYSGAEKLKDVLFEIAYRNFRSRSSPTAERQFAAFCDREAYWLDDFALYTVLRQQHNGKAWTDWPDKYKLRNTEALLQFAQANRDALQKAMWLQFISSRQWNSLKSYCHRLGIELFGDMPFYVSYDSADVWANPDIFCLDEQGNMTGVAGVPPDYFNENGQLWGMPVFRWDVLKKQKYEWWIHRIRKNTELFDLLRFDHFRAFSAYWEVPAGEDTAKNGEWKPGPGKDFFRAVQRKLGKLPFVAEDLGDIDPPVYELRDNFGFPGMKVLQFAFGDDMPHAISIPHGYTANFFVYTGTHDNNTTRGWYRKDADKTVRKNLEDYTGSGIKGRNVHLILSRMAYASVAKTVILPVQDVLGLDERGRMNTPATAQNNWIWRLKPGQLTAAEAERLREWVRIYGRE